MNNPPTDDNSLQQWFDNTRRVLETAYLSHEEPWRQSGMSSPSLSLLTRGSPRVG